MNLLSGNWLLLITIIAFTIYCSESKSLKPVILVPGFGHSRIEAKLNKTKSKYLFCKLHSDNYALWQPKVQINWKCWAENFILSYNESSHETYTDGVQSHIPNFGKVPKPNLSLDKVDQIYKKMIRNLEKNGYVSNKNIFFAPYDFRKSYGELEKFFSKLRSFVEDVYGRNNETQVIFITHSYGSDLAIQFLGRQSPEWKTKYISKLFTLSSASGGSASNLHKHLNWFRRKQLSDAIYISFPMLNANVPWRSWWNDNVLIETKSKNFTANNYEEFFSAINYTVGTEMHFDAEELRYSDGPDVELHCMYCLGQSTTVKYVYKTNLSAKTAPKIIKGDGDGLISRHSLEICKNWQQFSNNIYTNDIHGCSHNSILYNAKAIKYILQNI